MRQRMPHRNNIDVGRMKSKRLVRAAKGLRPRVTYLPQVGDASDMAAFKFHLYDNGLRTATPIADEFGPQMDISGMSKTHDEADPLRDVIWRSQ